MSDGFGLFSSVGWTAGVVLEGSGVFGAVVGVVVVSSGVGDPEGLDFVDGIPLGFAVTEDTRGRRGGDVGSELVGSAGMLIVMWIVPC